MVVYQSVDPNPRYGLVPRHLRLPFNSPSARAFAPSHGLKVDFGEEPVTIGVGGDLGALVKRLAERLPRLEQRACRPVQRRASEPCTPRLTLMWREPYWSTEPELDLAPVVHLRCNFKPHSRALPSSRPMMGGHTDPGAPLAHAPDRGNKAAARNFS